VSDSQGVIDLLSLRVAVLMGGDSTEREVSLRSGAAVVEALTSLGHRVSIVDPSQTRLAGVDWPRFDIAFLALHGRFGEDGQIQSLFESWGVPFTGSDAAAARLSFSKSAAKERFAACGVPTPEYVLIHESDSPAQLQRAADQIGYPLVVKPDASGSSLGVSIITSPDQLSPACVACFDEGPFGLLERMISGSEWTLGVIDDERLPLIRIDARRPFYDFTAKYDDDGTGYQLEADLPESTRGRISSAAAGAAAAVGTCGIARVDVRLDDEQRPWVLEVNSIPGFTDHSLVPKAAAHAGIAFAQLCERAIESGLRAHQMRRHNRENASIRPQRHLLRPAG
jgi:D-alanine-D-alanine ligase